MLEGEQLRLVGVLVTPPTRLVVGDAGVIAPLVSRRSAEVDGGTRAVEASTHSLMAWVPDSLVEHRAPFVVVVLDPIVCPPHRRGPLGS